MLIHWTRMAALATISMISGSVLNVASALGRPVDPIVVSRADACAMSRVGFVPIPHVIART